MLLTLVLGAMSYYLYITFPSYRPIFIIAIFLFGLFYESSKYDRVLVVSMRCTAINAVAVYTFTALFAVAVYTYTVLLVSTPQVKKTPSHAVLW